MRIPEVAGVESGIVLSDQSKLVAVVGHAAFSTVCSPDDLPPNPFESPADPWVLADFQKGEPSFYGGHLQRGLELAAQDPEKTLLVLSGGYTRKQSVGGAHNWSEAESYLRAGEKSGWFRIVASQVLERPIRDSKIEVPVSRLLLPNDTEVTVAENRYARDSVENVLGDLATFFALCGKIPEHMTVAGWGFKEKRFIEHARALGIPESRFTYVGVNNPEGKALEGAQNGEAKALEAFLADPFGNTGYLAAKRVERDPLNRGNPHWDLLSLLQVKMAA